jgi:hypothetical protein
MERIMQRAYESLRLDKQHLSTNFFKKVEQNNDLMLNELHIYFKKEEL